MKKKLISIVLSISLLLTFGVVGAVMASGTPATYTLAAPGGTSGGVNDIIPVSLGIANNPGWNNITIFIEFNPAILALTCCCDSMPEIEVITSGAVELRVHDNSSNYTELSSGKLRLQLRSQTPASMNNTGSHIAVLHFKIIASVPSGGTKITVLTSDGENQAGQFTIGNRFDVLGTELTITQPPCAPGSCVPGDSSKPESFTWLNNIVANCITAGTVWQDCTVCGNEIAGTRGTVAVGDVPHIEHPTHVSARESNCEVAIDCIICSAEMVAANTHAFTADPQMVAAGITGQHNFGCANAGCTARGNATTCTVAAPSTTAWEANCTLDRVCICGRVMFEGHGTHESNDAMADDCTVRSACTRCNTPMGETANAAHLRETDDCTSCQRCPAAPGAGNLKASHTWGKDGDCRNCEDCTATRAYCDTCDPCLIRICAAGAGHQFDANTTDGDCKQCTECPYTRSPICTQPNLADRCKACQCSHNWAGVVFTRTLEPTCTEVGKESEKCTLCDYRRNERDIPALQHAANPAHVTARLTNCQTVVQCVRFTECSHVVTAAFAGGHAFTANRAPIGAGISGSHDFRCANDECTQRGGAVTCAINNQSAVDANCTVAGVCECGRIMIPSGTHNFNNPSTMAQTGTTQHDFKCVNCNVRGGAVNCTISNAAAVAANCTLDTVCACGRIMKAGTAGHDWRNFGATIGLTCTASGTRTRTCWNCTSTNDEEVPMLGHSWVSDLDGNHSCSRSGCDATEACNDIGTNGACDVCGYIEPDPDCDHDTDWVEVTAATCSTPGLENEVCRDCDGTVSTRTINALPHDFPSWDGIEWNPAASCLVAGSRQRECPDCKTIDTATQNALDHSFTGAWTVRTAATTSAPGLEFRVCARDGCDAEETQPIAQLTDTTGGGTGTGTGTGTTPPPVTTPAPTTTLPPVTTPVTPSDPGPDVVTPSRPVIVYEPEAFIDDAVVINVILEAIESGETPVIELAEMDGSVISAEVLQAIAESGVDVVVELENGLTFTIIADSISDDAAAFDLNITIDFTSRATMFATAANDVRVPANAIVISPNFHGDFGFEIQFSFTAEELAEAGINGNNVRLWYICDRGTVTDTGRVKLNADGSIEFTMDSASFYVLSEEKPEGFTIDDDANAKTGVTIGLVAIIVPGAALLLAKRKRK